MQRLQTTTEEDLGRCVSRRIENQMVLAVLRAARHAPELRFIIDESLKERLAADDAQLKRLSETFRIWTPVDYYQACFELEPDARVIGRMKLLLDKERDAILDGTAQINKYDRDGYIYVFHFLSDPSHVIKIGRTIRSPEQRRAEWEHQLAPEEGVSVVMLFSYKTLANVFAESIIHTVLTCQHAAGRINVLSNDSLEEFFAVPNLMALKMFIRQTIQYIDQFSRYWRAQRRSAPVTAAAMSTTPLKKQIRFVAPR